MVTGLFHLLVSKNKLNSHCHEHWRRLSNVITCLAEPLDKIVILRLYTLTFQSWEGWTWARLILLFTRRGDEINDNSRESRLHPTLAGLVTRYQKVQSTGKIKTFLRPRSVEALFGVNRLTFRCRRQTSLQLEMICKIWQLRNGILFIPFN